MTRPIRPALLGTALSVDVAIGHLMNARDILKRMDCPKTLARVRLAISSAYGVKRHAGHRERRTRHVR